MIIRIVILYILILSNLAFANNSPSNRQIIGDIERHLFFDPKTGDIKTNDASYIGKEIITDENQEEYKPKFDIVTIDADFNKNSEEKKKLAYNANLMGHYEVAIKLYNEILDKNANDDNAKFALAYAYQKLHQYNDAKNLYYDLLNRGTKIDKDKIVSNLLSIIIEENPKEAVFFLTKLSAQHPDSADLIAKSALTYQEINKKEKALDLMEKALLLDPENSQYKYNLAIMYDQKGEYKEAKYLYDQILSELTRSDSEKLGISLDKIYERVKYLEENI
jgi:tetratricopeptide (TPR) repeat protein